MKMKHIEARDMQEALKIARSELGEDAVLLHSEKGSAGIIVTFAIEEMEIEDALSAALQDDTPHDYAAAPWQQVLPQPAPAAPRIFRNDHPALALLNEMMAFHAIPPEMANALQLEIESLKIPLTSTLDAAETLLTKGLAPLLRYAPIKVAPAANQRAIMLVGPYGAGKTTVIAKLATEFTLKKIPVMLISTDTERMGGIAPLREVADILKCDVLVAENRTQLRNLVKSQLGKHALLIDSAGVNIYRFAELKALGELASLADIEPILTCPAGIDPQEAQEMASVFSFLDIERMILTRVDAARHFASLFAAIHHSPYALASLSASASPADALQACTAELLARHLLTHTREKMAH